MYKSVDNYYDIGITAGFGHGVTLEYVRQTDHPRGPFRAVCGLDWMGHNESRVIHGRRPGRATDTDGLTRANGNRGANGSVKSKGNVNENDSQ